MRTDRRRIHALVFLAAFSAALVSVSQRSGGAGQSALRQALTFHAAFDRTVDAVHAAGDPKLYWAPNLKARSEAKPGLPPTGAQQASGLGRFGDALQFTAPKSPVVFFNGEHNMPYASSNWSGTVSFWLSADPEGELAPGFCDPVQITPRAWNDAAFFVEFEKRPEAIPFRLGVYADLSVWNPEKRRIADIPTSERPLITVEKPPFGKGKWTHVLFTFERFNTGKPDGIARLYLDGTARGSLTPRQQTFTWTPGTTLIALGLNYVGLMDDLAIFNRVLDDQEIQALYKLEKGVAGL